MASLISGHFVFIAAVFCLCVLAVSRLEDFAGVRYATSDNIDFGVTRYPGVHGDSAFDLGWNIALKQSRPFHAILSPIDMMVSAIHNQVLYDLLSLGSLMLAVVLASVLLGILTTRWLSILYITLFVSFFPQLWHHTPPAAYPVWPWLPILFFSLGALAFIDYVRRRRRYSLVIAGVFYFMSLASYEVFMLVFPVGAVMIVLRLAKTHEIGKQFLFSTLVVIGLITALYVVPYAFLRLLRPSNYAGVMAGVVSFENALRTIVQYSVSGFIFYFLWAGKYPVFYRDSFDHSQVSLIPSFGITDILQSANTFDLILSAVAAILGVLALVKLREKIRAMTYILICAGAAVMAVLSLLLFGVASKYAGAVDNPFSAYHTAYVGTRHAYFVWVLFLAALLGFFAVVAYRHRMVYAGGLVLVALALFLGSLGGFYFNGEVHATMRVQKAKWDAVDLALECSPFESRRSGRTYSAPRLGSSVWWATIRDASSYPERTENYWDYYSRQAHGIVGRIWDPRFAGEEGSLFFDYRLGSRGELLGVFSALQTGALRADEIAFVTDRREAVQLIYDDLRGSARMEILSWGQRSDACGEKMVNLIRGKGIDLSSVVLHAPPVVPLFSPLRQSANGLP